MSTATAHRPMRRREFHAATAKSAFTTFAAKQMFMPYRHNKMAAVEKGFEFKPGFIYAKVRAISARINQNYDGWPSSELKKSYRTFIGKPIFVNHQNFDYKKARGKVVASRYVEAGDDKYIETVMEIDAARFPKLAHEIKTGGLDSVSMGVEAGFTICSYCGNKAVDTPQFCAHVKYHKGERLPRINERTGAKEDVLVYEKCYKLGFFELSWVFDPADETAMTSHVITAAEEDVPPPDEIVEGEMPYAMMPQARRKRAKGMQQILQDHRGNRPVNAIEGQPADSDYHLDRGNTNAAWALQKEKQHGKPLSEFTDDDWAIAGNPPGHHASRYHLGYGEIEAPEDVDTLRNEEDGPDDGTDEFKHYVESPKELRGPDLDQTKQLDRAQEQQGLDADRRVEDVEDIGGIPMAARTTRRAARRQSSPGVLVDPRTGRRYYAADEDDDKKRDDAPPPDEDATDDDFGGEDDGSDYDEDGDFDPDHDGDDDANPEGDTDGDFAGADDGGDFGDDLGGGDELGGPPPPGGDDLGADPAAGDAGPGVPPGASDQDLIQEAEQDLMHADALAGDDFSMDPGSNAGGTMDDYSDPGLGSPAGGGLGGDDLGGDHFDPDADGDDDSDPVLDFDRSHHPELGTHPAVQEAIEQLLGGGGGAPPPPQHQGRRNGNQRGSSQKKRKGGPQMSLAQRGQMVASRQSRRHHADDNGYTDGGPYHTDDNDQGEKEDTFITQTPGAEAVAAPTPGDGTISNTENNLVARKLRKRIQQARAQQQRDIIAYEQITGRRIRAEAVESPDKVDPTVNTGPAAEELTGKDFEDVGLEDVETQPKDASRHASAFDAFNYWLKRTTGKTARQHGNVKYIRRQAARWCSANKVPANALFPAMGIVLREAQRNEGANRRAAMKRHADESLEVAAPQDRIDVEAPVRDTTDAEAQASQFDLGDFGDNAGDNLADPELSVDTQIWAPGEGDSSVKKDSNRKADGITAVRYAEAYIRAGLGEDTPEEKWKIAGLAMNMRHGTIADRISVLDAVNAANAQRFAALKRQASRGGAPRGLPQGFGQRQMTAGTNHEAANDIAMDDLSLWAGR